MGGVADRGGRASPSDQSAARSSSCWEERVACFRLSITGVSSSEDLMAGLGGRSAVVLQVIAVRSVASIAWYSTIYPYSLRAGRPINKLCLL